MTRFSSKNVVAFLLFLMIRRIIACETEEDDHCGYCLENRCISCYNSFKVGNKCVKPEKPIANCKIYFSEEICLQCMLGYSLDQNFNFCFSNGISGCIDSLDSMCFYCDNHFLYVDGRQCESSIKCKLEGCRSCNILYFQESCELCADDYVIEYQTNRIIKTCRKRQPETEGCSRILDNQCVHCKYGYKDVELVEKLAICKKANYSLEPVIQKSHFHFSCHNGNDEFCRECGEQGCTKCLFSYPEERGNCLFYDLKIANCLYYSSKDTCLECKDGYYLKDNFCIWSKLEDCLHPLDEFKCKICKKVELTASGKCDPEKPCEIEHCQSCKSEDGQKCTLCEIGFTLDLDSNACIEYGKASIENDGCEVMQDSDCLRCAPRYYIASKKGLATRCLFSKRFTDFEQLDTQNVTCSTGSDKYCTVCVNNKCVNCENSFEDLLGVCVVPENSIENCESYLNQNECKRCKKNYFLSSDLKQCIRSDDPNCIIPLDTATCLHCVGYNQESAGACIPDIGCLNPACKSCNKQLESESCVECDEGYVLSFVRRFNFQVIFDCVKKNEKNPDCLMFENEKCLKCKRGFFQAGVDENGLRCEKTDLYEISADYLSAIGFFLYLMYFLLLRTI